MQNQFHLSVDGEILTSQSDNFDPDESESDYEYPRTTYLQMKVKVVQTFTFTHKDQVFDQDFNDNESADLE